MSEELMVKVDNVYKRYRLGLIGGGTLAGDIQSWWAKVRHKEDPNSKIGEKVYGKNEVFYALNGISFEVKKGEALGIIGGNGAGKSTTLKLLSQVTAPTEGKIYLNGRVASMLEVGTGFHPELTGRENIYLNGAILGMTKSEIDTKIEKIIDFSECRQFIDTPVKRYSSGMYVKLAFSVAAHLDSEIMIMDEVLAVGDMAFQKKCIEKMKSISNEEGRTILYVSHNMNTIKQLCDRVIVLDHGKLIYDGNTEKGIERYLNMSIEDVGTSIDLNKVKHDDKRCNFNIVMKHLDLQDKIVPEYYDEEELKLSLKVDVIKPTKNIVLRLTFRSELDVLAGTVWSDSVNFDSKGSKIIKTNFPLNLLPSGSFYVSMGLYEQKSDGFYYPVDFIHRAFMIDISQKPSVGKCVWNSSFMGYVKFPDNKLTIKEEK